MIQQTIVRYAALVALIALAACSDGSTVDPDADDGGTVTLPVRVHLVFSDRFPALDTRLTDEQVSELLGEVNRVWAAAEVQWDVTAVVRAEALESDRFQEMMDAIGRGQDLDVDVLRRALPRQDRVPGEWDIFLIHDLGESPVAGVYFGAGLLVAKVTSPEGSLDLQGFAGRVLAHELGHSLSLPHVPCVTQGNLMAAGCLGDDRTRLEPAQVAAARLQSRSGSPF